MLANTFEPFFVQRLWGGRLSTVVFISVTEGNRLQSGINPTAEEANVPAWPCGASYLIVLLKRQWMHFSPCDHRASVAIDWAGLLARSPPLWCVLINTTLIVPWCYLEAWKWALFSIDSLLDSFLLATSWSSKQSQHGDWHWLCQRKHAIFN